jgi:hypothetical protein
MQRRGVLAAVAGIAIAAASLAGAQNIIFGGSRGGVARWATAADYDGSFHYCRGYYTSIYREAGGMGWWTDYPAADNNFSVRLAELTRVHVELDASRQPNFVVVTLDDPLLFRCPILFMEDVGTMQLTEDEVRNLRAYLVKGGFLWVDDFWGSFAWEQWEQEIGRVLPPGEFPIRTLPMTHPILKTLYDVNEVPQIPSINFWGGNRSTSERGSDSAMVNFKGIEDGHGRLMVVMTHNTDIADSWEREGENHEYFATFSPRGYAIGVNFVLYAMTH